MFCFNVDLMRVSEVSYYIRYGELNWCPVLDCYGLLYAEESNFGRG